MHARGRAMEMGRGVFSIGKCVQCVVFMQFVCLVACCLRLPVSQADRSGACCNHNEVCCPVCCPQGPSGMYLSHCGGQSVKSVIHHILCVSGHWHVLGVLYPVPFPCICHTPSQTKSACWSGRMDPSSKFSGCKFQRVWVRQPQRSTTNMLSTWGGCVALRDISKSNHFR